MLETPEQRIRLLKAGFSGKEIETLYIEYNNFRIVNLPILYDLEEFDGINMKIPTTVIKLQKQMHMQTVLS